MREAFSPAELRVLRRLSTPAKIQDFLNAMPFNFETDGDTCRSPRRVLRDRTANCMEGAMFAAAVLRLHGHRPLVMDLESADDDHDHVVAPFRAASGWGAISKTNHGVLRYREPIYRSVRELAMTYFHEYFLDDGRKTLRRHSGAVNLGRFDRRGWMTAEHDVWFVPEHLCDVPHFDMLGGMPPAALRRADAVEIAAGKIVEQRPLRK